MQYTRHEDPENPSKINFYLNNKACKLKVVFSRIYLDVPEELEKQIEEKSSSSRVTQIMPLPALLLSLLLCFS